MAEEKGSGFGKLVFGVVAGNGYNTDGMSFEQAYKIFEKLGGEENWKAKELKMKADEESAKEKQSGKKDTRTERIAALDQEIDKMSVSDPKRYDLLREKHALEDSIKAEEKMAIAKEKYPIGTEIHDIYNREWLEVVGYNERDGAVRLRGNGGTISRLIDADKLDELYDASPVNPPRKEVKTQKAEPKAADYNTELQRLSKEQNVDFDVVKEDLQSRLDEGQSPEEALKEIENNLKNAEPESMKDKIKRKLKGLSSKSKETPNEYKGIKMSPDKYGLLKVSHPGGEFLAADYEDAKAKIDQREQDDNFNKNLQKLVAENQARKRPLSAEEQKQQRQYWARRKPGKTY